MKMTDFELGVLNSYVADKRSTHRACVRLLRQRDPDRADQVATTWSNYYGVAGTAEDPAHASLKFLLRRLGVLADLMPRIIVGTIPRSALWAATGPIEKDKWVVVIPVGVVSFFRRFLTIIFEARDQFPRDPELRTSIDRMSALLGVHLEVGAVDFRGFEKLAEETKPLLEHLTQLTYDFMILHECAHIREGHCEPDEKRTTFYQEAHLRHEQEFAADRWAFNTLLSSYSNNLRDVAVAIALLFDALELLDRFDFAPMARLSHPSAASRKWRLMRLLEAPDALEFLDAEQLTNAREFSQLYERLAAFIVDRAMPASPLNQWMNNWSHDEDKFVITLLFVMAQGDPEKVVSHLARVRASSFEWAEGGTEDDAQFVIDINRGIDALSGVMAVEPSLSELANVLVEAANAGA